jgi:hypothetical protein
MIAAAIASNGPIGAASNQNKSICKRKENIPDGSWRARRLVSEVGSIEKLGEDCKLISVKQHDGVIRLTSPVLGREDNKLQAG